MMRIDWQLKDKLDKVFQDGERRKKIFLIYARDFLRQTKFSPRTVTEMWMQSSPKDWVRSSPNI